MNRTFLACEIRHCLREALSKKLMLWIVFFSFILGFCLHDSDLIALGEALTRGSPLVWGLYGILGMGYFLTLSDLFFKKSPVSSFLDTLPLDPRTVYFGEWLKKLILQIPLLYGVGLCLAPLGALGTGLIVIGVNYLLLACVKFSLPVLISLPTVTPGFFYLKLLAHSQKGNLLKDFGALGLLLVLFWTLGWGEDPEAINFMFFVFCCFAVSLSRYVTFLEDLSGMYPKVSEYGRTLPTKGETLQGFAVFSLLPILFSGVYFGISASLPITALLLGLSLIFAALKKGTPKFSVLISLAFSVAVFAYIRNWLP
jgi:hypothetical protein